MTVLDWSVLQIKTKIISSHTADSKPVKQEVNGTVILPPLIFPALAYPLIPLEFVRMLLLTLKYIEAILLLFVGFSKSGL